MANKATSMSKIRQIIKLFHKENMGKRRIGERLGMSKNTVRMYIEIFQRLNMTWEEICKQTDFELNRLFHPPKDVLLNPRVAELYAFFPDMKKQLTRKGMTVRKQFDQYKLKCQGSYAETAFYGYYNLWSNKLNPSMHIEHKVGDKMYVDFAGATLPYVDTQTGEIKRAQVFVAILGWSQYTYVEAMKNQTIEEFLAACENAIHYFKGVPLAIVPDNLKSAVFKANRYEPSLNENFKAFADHYGIAIIPARARKPKDKAHVENMVKITYQKIYTNVPEKEIMPLNELNADIWKHLATLNDGTLTGKDCSRTDQWLMELSSLSPLPATGYQIMTIRQVTVTKFGHVILRDDNHKYSVPVELLGKKLRMQYSRTEVFIYDNYELVAKHKRIRSRGNFTTDPAHRPPSHLYYGEWTPTFFIEKAKVIDPVVEYYIRQVIAGKQHPDQAYPACNGILNYAKRVGTERLIKACKRANEFGYYNFGIIDDILKKNLDKYDDDPSSAVMPAHDNIRGGDYYK
jgi:transposase